MHVKKYSAVKSFIEPVSAVLAVVMFYAILDAVGIGCPIKYLTGVSCAGCGMTRAWIALFHLDFQKAFYYHPLFFLPPIVVLVILFKAKVNIKVYKILIFTVIILFVTIYLSRMVMGVDDVVVFHPSEGLIYRIIKNLIPDT